MTEDIGIPFNAYGYVYMNYYIDTDMWYIGQHKSSKLDWHYYGSGDNVLNGIKNKKLKTSNICSMILDWAVSEDELTSKELYWINYFNAVNSSEFYNIADWDTSVDSNPTLVPVICVELNKKFRTIKDAAEWCNRSKSALTNALKGISKTCAGYHWVYEDEEAYHKIVSVRNQNYFINNKTFRKGSKHSEDSKQKMREAALGRKHSKESIEKMSKSQRKRFDNNTVSEKTCKKLSIALSGEKNPMYGKKSHNTGGWHQPDSAKEAIRNSRLGKKDSLEVRNNKSKAQKERYKKEPIKPHVIEALRKANLGKAMSEETKKKLSDINKGKTLSSNTREKISTKLKGHEPAYYTEVYCPELDMKFHTIRDATEFVGLKDSKGIRSCIKNEVKHAGKYIINGKLTKLTWVKVGDNYECKE